METLTRLVAESLARHGFDRPVDYRRLQWSHWFRCESHHSLLVVPSKPGVFALAEEIMDLGIVANREGYDFRHGETSAPQASALAAEDLGLADRSNHGPMPEPEGRNAEADSSRRMLAVAQFFEDDDMAFVLDRMLSQQNPMRARLASGHYFVRFVEIHDQAQRGSICSALNQWILSSTEKATSIGSHFATSLELTPESSNAVGTYRLEADITNQTQVDPPRTTAAPRLNSAVATTIHGSSSFPSGF